MQSKIPLLAFEMPSITFPQYLLNTDDLLSKIANYMSHRLSGPLFFGLINQPSCDTNMKVWNFCKTATPTKSEYPLVTP
jgi:hypothetical protein